jgi:GntR family transcriptional regulator
VIVRLTPGDARPIYVQIMDEIRRAIVLGTLAHDDPLPSTRELARDLRVNPNTVQLAYRELERLGVAYVRRGQGTYVANNNAPEREQRRLVREVSERAARDAYRHGITIEQLIAALSAKPARKPSRGRIRAEEEESDR